MSEDYSQPDNDNFDEDKAENLSLENDIIKLKMQAQFGAVFGSSEAGLTPELENMFLKNVQQLEEAWQDVKYIKVYDLLGRPVFEKSENLSSDEIETELIRIKALLKEKEIFLDVLGDYNPTIIYRFITEELFEHETEDMYLEGYQRMFTYEDFHPNHKMDLERIAQHFISDWSDKDFNHFRLECNDGIVTSDGKQFSTDEMISKLNKALACYVSFSNLNYKFLDTAFEWDVAQDRGMGYVEGVVEYKAELISGNRIHFDGPFKFYFSNQNGYWNVFYFIFPGFDW